MDPEEKPLEDLKTRINELLWTALPGSTTLAEAEEIATGIYDQIIMVWQRRIERV